MTGGIEAAGDVVTGGLIARAIEQKAGEAGEGDAQACLNCGSALAGNYCHNCGQSSHVHRTISAFWHDFTHSILHFEGKIWRTLPLLFLRPGELTRRYVHGERARFISPLALFLFSVFLMFATFSLVGTPLGTPVAVKRDGVVAGKAELRAELLKAQARLAALQQAGVTGKQLENARDEVAALELGSSLANGTAAGGGGVDSIRIDTGYAKVDEALRKAAKDPKLLLYKMQSNAYKFSWALIPISIPFVWLLFMFRRQFKPYDHAIFVTYSLSFMSLLLVTFSILGRLGPLASMRGPLFMFAPPAHIFFQLRGAYQVGILAAAWRTIALLGIAFVVLTLFGIILLTLGVAG